MKRREFFSTLAILPASLAFGISGFSLKPGKGVIKEIVIDKLSHINQAEDGFYIDYIFHFKKQRCSKCGQDGEYQIIFNALYPSMKLEHMIQLVKKWKNKVLCTACGSEMALKLHEDCRFIKGKGW